MEDRNLFLLLKPEVANHIGRLDEFIAQKGFSVVTQYGVKDWADLNRVLYAPQLEDEKFASEFEAYVWLCDFLFGNRAVVLTLNDSAKGATLENSLKKLTDLKYEFRKQLPETTDGTIIIHLDLNKLPKKIDAIGTNGHLVVLDSGGTEILRYQGRWDNYFFKYIHTPDPNIATFKRELEVLVQEEIICQKNVIPEKEWCQMKFLGTLTLPSSYYDKH